MGSIVRQPVLADTIPVFSRIIPMEAVTPIAEALTLCSTFHDLCRSLTSRVENFRQNRKQFAVLKEKLSNAEGKVIICSKTLEEYSEAIMEESFEFELTDLRGLIQDMRHVKESIEE